MKSLRYLSTISALALCAVFALAQDPGLGRGRGGGGNGGGSNPPSKPSSNPPSSSPQRGPSSPPRQDPPRSNPPRQDPPRNDPPKSNPPRQDPPRNDPPRSNPPRQDPPRNDPPRSNPPRNDPPRSNPPRQDPPRNDPPRSNPPRQDPPRNDPPRSNPPQQDGGLGRGGNTRGGGNSGPGSTPPQDGGLGRGKGNQGGGNTGPGSNPPSRGNDNSGPTRDRGGNNQPPVNRGGNNDPGLGRPQRGSDPGMTRGRDPQVPSRSGTVAYRGSNNATPTRTAPNANYNIPPRSYGVINTNSMEFRAARQDAPRHSNSLYYNGWRTGYCHYNPNFVDVNFWYPNYCFTPYAGVNVVISPWYSYTFLPGYLNHTRVTVINYRSSWFWNVGTAYVYDSGYGNWGYDSNSRRNRDLEYAVDDFVDGFERQDYRSLQRVVPDHGRVAIMRDGEYDYSLDVRDFEDLLNDLVGNADTNKYRILETRTYRNSAKISAVHEYRDQWGNRQRTYHMIYLEEEDGRLVVREFGTSNRRIW